MSVLHAHTAGPCCMPFDQIHASCPCSRPYIIILFQS
jgi:hypothetical protein